MGLQFIVVHETVCINPMNLFSVHAGTCVKSLVSGQCHSLESIVSSYTYHSHCFVC